MHDRENASSMYYTNAWKRLIAFTKYCFVDYKRYVESGLKGSDAEYDSFHGGLGQYYFINVPAYSDVQWHPFSVSEIVEGPQEGLATGGYVQFHIKNMGPGTFTGHLASIAQAQRDIAQSEKQDLATPLKISVKLSGPHGSLSINLADYQHIVLIAGGIGITPMLPILDRIRHWCRRDTDKAKKFPRLERVSVLWVARQDNKSLFAEFADRVVQSPLVQGPGQGPGQGQGKRKGQGKGQSYGSFKAVADDGIQLNTVTTLSGNLQTVTPAVSVNVTSGNDASYRALDSHLKWDASFYVTVCSDTLSSFRTSSGKKHDCIIGRPNLSDFMHTAVHDGTGKSVCALLCGPAAMTTDAAKVCADLRVDYHIETFGW